MTLFYLDKKPGTCVWEVEYPLENIYRWADAGSGNSTVTCEPSNGAAIKIQLEGEWDSANKIIQWSLRIGIPWVGVDSTGAQGSYETVEIIWKDEQETCTLASGCENVTPVSVTISGNPGYSDNEGIFRSSWWNLANWCSVWNRAYGGIRVRYAIHGYSCLDKGSCCLPDGTCLDDTKFGQCIGLGGLWTKGQKCCLGFSGVTNCTSCRENKKRACCLPNGTCADTTQHECFLLGGTWNDDICANTTCPGIGKCCLPSGECRIMSSSDCTTAGGTYSGDGTNCNDGCASDPTGACCKPDDTCVETTNTICTGMGGTYQGDGTTCAGVSCGGGCELCEAGSTTPSSCSVIIGGLRSQSDATCNCDEFNGVFTLTQSDENPCEFVYENTCSGGNTVKITALCVGRPSQVMDKTGWQLGVFYNNSLLLDSGVFFVNCSGGAETGRRLSTKNGSLCDNTSSAAIDFIVNS